MDVYTIIPVGLHVLSSLTFHLLLTMHAQRWATFAHVHSSADTGDVTLLSRGCIWFWMTYGSGKLIERADLCFFLPLNSI